MWSKSSMVIHSLILCFLFFKFPLGCVTPFALPNESAQWALNFISFGIYFYLFFSQVFIWTNSCLHFCYLAKIMFLWNVSIHIDSDILLLLMMHIICNSSHCNHLNCYTISTIIKLKLSLPFKCSSSATPYESIS